MQGPQLSHQGLFRTAKLLCIFDWWTHDTMHWTRSMQMDWRDGVLQSTRYSCRELGLGSQPPHGGLQPCVTPVPGDLTHSLDLCGHQTCMLFAYIHADRTLLHKTGKSKKEKGPLCSGLHKPLLPTDSSDSQPVRITRC